MKNIIFDLDGTLVDSKELQINILKQVFSHFGTIPNVDFLTLIGPPLIDTFTRFLGENSAQNAYEYYNSIFKTTKIEGIRVFPQILEALPKLSKENRLFVASLQLKDIVERELEALKIREYFFAIGGDSVLNPATSKTEIISRIIEEFSLDTQNTIMVGDTEFDKISAEKNKIRFIQVGWGYGGKNKNSIESSDSLINAI